MAGPCFIAAARFTEDTPSLLCYYCSHCRWTLTWIKLDLAAGWLIGRRAPQGPSGAELSTADYLRQTL